MPCTDVLWNLRRRASLAPRDSQSDETLADAPRERFAMASKMTTRLLARSRRRFLLYSRKKAFYRELDKPREFCAIHWRKTTNFAAFLIAELVSRPNNCLRTGSRDCGVGLVYLEMYPVSANAKTSQARPSEELANNTCVFDS